MTTRTTRRKSQTKLFKNWHGYFTVGSKYFKNSFLKGRGDRSLTEAQYSRIVKAVFEEIWAAMIHDLWRFEMPYVNNVFFILECLGRGRVVDWPKTHKLNKIIRMSNLHTGERLFKISMRRTHKSSKKSRVYAFKPMIMDKDLQVGGTKYLGRFIKECSVNPNVPDFRAHIC
jgi:hypothetical protein